MSRNEIIGFWSPVLDMARLALLLSRMGQTTALLDHFVREGTQQGWAGQTERLDGLHVDHQLVFVLQLDGERLRPRSIEDAARILAGTGRRGLLDPLACTDG